MSSNKHLDTIKSVDKAEDFHIGGIDEMDSLMHAAETFEQARRKYIITFDATGSMSSYWRMSKGAVEHAMKKIKGKTNVPVSIQIVAYRDKDCDADWIEASEWSDEETYLKSFISDISCHGGGDEPESLQVPLEHALKEQSTPHQIIMLGDAPGKGPGQEPPHYTAARKLGAKECPVYTLWLTHSCKRDFEMIAKLSGGKSFQFGRDMDEEKMADIFMVILSQDKMLQITYQATTIEGKKMAEGMSK